jgi:uncharacterized RDD family membrane protein YckC
MTSGEFDSQSGPYAGPSPSVAKPGGLAVRFLARFVDGIIVGVIGYILVFALHKQSSILVTGVFTGVLMFAYFVALETTQGRTIGKKLFGLTVHGPAGAPKPDLSQSAIRNAFTLLPIVPFVGGLVAFIAMVVIAVTITGSPTKQGKHDELAGGTQVLKS